MAKLALINREKKRAKLVQKYAKKREALMAAIADETLETLLRSKVNRRLRDVEKLSFSQIRIVREVLAEKEPG